MARYRIEIKKSAVKEIKSLPPKDSSRLLKSIHALSENPRPQGCKKLTHREEYRIRVGQYRIIYTIEDDVLVVMVVKVGHRKDVYLR